MKFLSAPLLCVALLLMFAAPVNAQDQERTLESRATDLQNTDIPEVPEPFFSDRRTFSETERNIDQDINAGGLGIYNDKDGAAGRLGAESAGGLRGGVDTSIRRR